MKSGFSIILEIIKGKEVLDIGSYGAQLKKNKPKLLFNLIKERAKSVIGVDLKSDDKDIIQGNAETINLNRKFDVIIAGDLIEHLDNAGLFLDNMHRHLKDDGILIISTPNTKSLYILKKPNETHTCWYCRYTLRYLLKQHGFKVEKEIITFRKRENLIKDFIKLLFFNNLVFICKKR